MFYTLYHSPNLSYASFIVAFETGPILGVMGDAPDSASPMLNNAQDSRQCIGSAGFIHKWFTLSIFEIKSDTEHAGKIDPASFLRDAFLYPRIASALEEGSIAQEARDECKRVHGLLDPCVLAFFSIKRRQLVRNEIWAMIAGDSEYDTVADTASAKLLIDLKFREFFEERKLNFRQHL